VAHPIGNRIAAAIALMPVAAPAFAYIDPGSGAMLVQAILAVIAAAVFYVRNPAQLWRDMKKWLSRTRDDRQR
jgi:hypothetical protein